MTTDKKYKKYLPLEQQIIKLKDKNLTINNEAQAKKTLIKTSYYNLINGYKDCFLDPDSTKEKFKDDVSFNDIYMLYRFDSDLRKNILDISLSIEETIASTLAYVISDTYGDNKDIYLKRNNLRIGDRFERGRYRNEREKFLSKVDDYIYYAKDGPVKHYKENYENIPAWILVKVLSFGNLKIWYKLSKPEVKDRIVSIFFEKEKNNVTDKDKELFMKCLDILNQFRNKAAHGGRTYNYSGRVELPYTQNYHQDLLGISEDEYNSGKGRSDLTAFIIATFIISDKNFSFFNADIAKFIKAFQNNLTFYSEQSESFYEDVLKAMNIQSNIMNIILQIFPNDQKDIYDLLYSEELENKCK